MYEKINIVCSIVAKKGITKIGKVCNIIIKSMSNNNNKIVASKRYCLYFHLRCEFSLTQSDSYSRVDNLSGK